MSLFSWKLSPVFDIYNSVIVVKPRDKTSMILEPLHGMIQLALLSVLPVGTKIAIDNNLMQLQLPTIIQPIARWYNIYKKDDIYFLFQVIKRFIKWYNPANNQHSPLNKELYKLIIQMSINGLGNLLKTYDSSNSNALIQIVSMYRSMLAHDGFEKVLQTTVEFEKSTLQDNNHDIDEVFQSVITLYDPLLIATLHNTMLMIQKEENLEVINNMISGLSLLMHKTNKKIQSWIKQKLMI